MKIPDFDDVCAAQARIKPYVHRTPVLTSSYLDQLSGAEIFFKCENLQKVGAFKARGAVNAVFGLSDAEAAQGVATHSSGNHAGALSYAAMRRGIEATVVMPHNAPAAKKAAVQGYGGRIIECCNRCGGTTRCRADIDDAAVLIRLHRRNGGAHRHVDT